MGSKGNHQRQIENKTGIFFEIGLIVALSAYFLAFEWKVA